MPNEFEIKFDGDNCAPVMVENGQELSEVLDSTNSPLLFGCRTGICGVCIVEILDVKDGELPAANQNEAESLDLYAPQNPKARLACQLSACASLKIKKIKPL